MPTGTDGTAWAIDGESIVFNSSKGKFYKPLIQVRSLSCEVPWEWS